MSASSHPNGTYPATSRANSTYVTDSKADLVSMELSEAENRVYVVFVSQINGRQPRKKKFQLNIIKSPDLDEIWTYDQKIIFPIKLLKLLFFTDNAPKALK